MDSEARWRSGSEAVGHGLGGAVAQWLVAHHFVSPDTPDLREPDVSSNVS